MIKRYGILIFVLACILACTTIKEYEETVTLTTVIGLNSSPATRALTADGVKTFAPGDKVAVVYTKSNDYESKVESEPLSADNIFDNGKKARITVSLSSPKAGGYLRLIYPASLAKGYYGDVDYDALCCQDGTLASLASSLDLAVYEGTLTSKGTLPESVTLTNQLAIAAFNIKNASGADITSTITSLDINYGTNGYSVSRTAAEGPIYMALQAVGPDDDILICANDGTTYYMKSVAGKTLEAGNLYPVEVTMPVDETGLSEPLTIEAKTGGATVGYHKSSTFYSGDVNVQYRLNGGPWTDYDNNGGGIVLEHAGDKVSFRGNNDWYGQHTTYSTNYSYFFSNYADCYLYGNVMSLVNATGFATEDEITATYAFYRLFASEPHFLNHPTKDLLLPATTLATFCYDSMFEGSTGLTRAPLLPAVNLAQYCYQEMFKGCTGLIDVPDLPAVTLQSNCYNAMFNGCTSLEAAPAIAAEVLAGECCKFMFEGCTSLTTPPELPVTTLASSCYLQMFKDCTSLQTAPVLPAPTLASSCYQNMFWGCTNLNTVTCLATDISATDCTTGWFYGISGTGTFVKESNTEWPTGTAGIPEGWTVETYSVPAE